MNNDPLVSVIIPSYNHAHFLPEAIASILAQSYKNIEMIVVDDGSKDNTKEVVAPYIQKGQIQYIYKNNAGLSAARNTGLKASKGHFIKFLDSDDFLYPEQIKLQVEHIKNNPNYFSVSDCCYLLPNGKQSIHPYYPPMPEDRQLSIYIEANQAPVHSFLTPKTLIDKAGWFDETLTACEDWDLWLRILENGGVAKHCPYVGACYRILTTSMSADTTKMFLQRCQTIEKVNTWVFQKQSTARHEIKDDLLHSLVKINTKLIDEGFVRRKPVEQILNNSIRMLETILDKQLNRPMRLLWKRMGTIRYLRIKFKIKTLFKRKYAYNLLHEDENWKLEGGS